MFETDSLFERIEGLLCLDTYRHTHLERKKTRDSIRSEFFHIFETLNKSLMLYFVILGVILLTFYRYFFPVRREPRADAVSVPRRVVKRERMLHHIERECYIIW